MTKRMPVQPAFDLSNFKFTVIGEKISVPCEECDDEEDDCEEIRKDDTGPKRFAQYEINDLSRIWCRVVCVNTHPGGKRFRNSLLGPTGHIERMNVWTHLFASLVYLLHTVLRPLAYASRSPSLSNSLVTVDSACLVVTYFVSSAYHVYSANRFWSAVTRLADYAGIYLGIASGFLVDLSISTVNLTNVPWQAVADVWLAMAIMILFFAFRRVNLSIDETRLPYLENRCTMGLARSTNVDLEHSSLRAAAGTIMVFSWTVAVPASFNTLEQHCALVFLISHVVSTLILIGGMALDNMIMYPDTWFRDSKAMPTRCVCYSKREGCGGGWIVTSHALWHLVALLSTFCNTVGLEYVIYSSSVLSS